MMPESAAATQTRRLLQLVLVVAVLAGPLTPAVTAGVITLDPSQTGISLSTGREGAETLVITVSEVRLDPVVIDGRAWASVRVPTGHQLIVTGQPSLPYLVTDYLLGTTDAIRLELVGCQTRTIDLGAEGFVGVAPSKGHLPRTLNPADVPWTFDEKVYDSDQPFPGRSYWLEAPAIAGPLRSQAIRVPVASWQPASNLLKVVERVELRVIHEEEGPNPRLRKAPPLSGAFATFARRSAVNFAQARDGFDPLVEPGRLLILAYSSFVDEVQPLADWEQLVGYPTILTPLSAVPHSGGVPTVAEIKAYIQSLYDEPEGLAWIILVGDYEQIANPTGVFEGAACDPCYTKLEGNDNRPDAAISRISAQTGAQVTLQVNKFLHYERYPDTGSAAAWYTAATGVAGDDAGGGYYDWERVDLLWEDLVPTDPDGDGDLFTYTTFDKLYHSPSSTAVGDSYDEGRGLGLYIDHGADLFWVVSGFDTDDAHALTNGYAMPVIWDVACVNGAFDDHDECFAEAWLRAENGGAVSFEAAVTNESWVPPCDAQRGVVDSIIHRSAFTTGAQHIAGKTACFDINGETNSSEGTKFMEQSTLFGSCVLWPRTEEPSVPDEPTDMSYTGGVASLTVTVGGQPLALEGGAIVNFYQKSGGTITAWLGSGLTDAAGVVHVPVSDAPTHCHIHGHNLVPTEFEIQARPDGSVQFDALGYSCTGLVTVRVGDSNVPGSGPATTDHVTVTVASSGGGSTDVVLDEETPDRNFFSGSLTLGTDLVVADGDTLTVTYVDADDGAGGVDVPKTDTAEVDCVGPVVSNVQAVGTQDSLTITFETDEPGTTTVVWGASKPPTQVVQDTALTTDHSVTLTGLTSCTRYYFEIITEDGLGNQTTDDNGGSYYHGDSAGWATVVNEPLDSDPGWSIDNGGNAHGWAFGQPLGLGGEYGSADPTSGHTGSNVYGVNLAGDYDNGLSVDQLVLTMPAVDCTEMTSVQLSYWRWLGVESPTFDHARVQMSVDGGGWSTVWENTARMDAGSWEQEVVDVSSAAAGHGSVQFRWTQGRTDGGWRFCGWNIDDVQVEGAVPCVICADPPQWIVGREGVGSVSEVNDGGSCTLTGLDIDWDEAESSCAENVWYRVWVQKGSTVDFGQPATFEGLESTELRVMGLSAGQEYAVAVRSYDEFGNEHGNVNVMTATPTGGVSGDVDGDGDVDAPDMMSLLEYFFAGTVPSGNPDVDCTGGSDASDLACEIDFQGNGLY